MCTLLRFSCAQLFCIKAMVMALNDVCLMCADVVE